LRKASALKVLSFLFAFARLFVSMRLISSEMSAMNGANRVGMPSKVADADGKTNSPRRIGPSLQDLLGLLRGDLF
jgi:hypothetical protein